MFQVATPVHAFSHHGHGHHLSPMTAPAVQLPRTLSRPHYSEVSRESITAVAPELANVPAEYIRRGLRARAPQMQAGLACLSLPVSIPKCHVPSSLSVPVRGTSVSSQPTYPTHLLAIAHSKSSPNEHASLFPVHSVIIASQCTTLPRLPPSSGPSSGSVHLPVLPLTLPSPAAFKLLHTYLYDHSLEGLMRSLFPLPSPFVQSLSHHTIQSTLASGSSLHQLSSYLCSSTAGSLQALTTHAAHVKELWQDIVALGIHDPELWDALDLSWEVVLGALNLAATGN